MRIVAVSACLLGEKCRYDAQDNKNEALLEKLQEDIIIPFCPEDYAFGSPRPTMDLIRFGTGDKAISNESGLDLSAAVTAYAIDFFHIHKNIDFLIGKDRSPSCGVCSARVYDEEKNLIGSSEAGLMVKEAQRQNILCIDAEDFKG